MLSGPGDTVYQDTVYQDTVYQDTVYQDTVYQDTVYQDTVYQDTARFMLSTVLRYRFEYVGDPADLAEATELARAALAAAAADDAGHRASCLGHLGVCLMLAAGPTRAGWPRASA